jgi:hypothetical protein
LARNIIILNNNNNDITIIQVYLRADSAARWPVTEKAQIYVEQEKSTTYNMHK